MGGARIHDDNDIGDVAVEGALQQHLGSVQPPAAGCVCQLGTKEVVLHAQAQLSGAAFPLVSAAQSGSHGALAGCGQSCALQQLEMSALSHVAVAQHTALWYAVTHSNDDGRWP